MGFPAHPQPHSRASDKTVDDSVYSPQYPYAMGPHCWSWKLLKMDRRSPPSGSLRPLRSHSSCYNQRSHGQRLDADNASEVPLVWDNRSSCHCARAQSMALTGTPVSLQPGAVGEMSSQNMQYFIIHVIIELVDVPAFESGGSIRWQTPLEFPLWVIEPAEVQLELPFYGLSLPFLEESAIHPSSLRSRLCHRLHGEALYRISRISKATNWLMSPLPYFGRL